MADNITLNSGSGGAVLATDDISSVHYQIIKLAHGALDSATVVSQASPLPVDIRAENASVTVDNGGTFAVQVDGDALTALQLIDNLVLAEDAAHQSADPGIQVLAVRTASPADKSGADGDYEPLQMDNGRLWTSAVIDTALPAGDNNIGNVDIASSVAIAVTDNSGSLTVDNEGTFAVQVDGDALTSIQAIETAVEILDNAISGSEMQVDVVGSLPAGTNNIGDVDIASALPAGSNLIGNVGIGVRTSGGCSIYYDADLDETAVAVKAGAGQIYAIHAFNTTAAPLFLQLFNVAQGSVTVGTTTPTMQYVIPGNADSDGAGFVLEVPMGIAFSTAITAACSTNSEGNSAPGSGACIINILYA